MNKTLLILLLVFSCFATTTAQTAPIRFQSITIDDGLSLSSVYCINKDSRGFMWFGTEDGLNRYDGYNFKVYRTDVNNPNTICYKWIEVIEEDSIGNLWFGSRNGLSHFNPRKEVFVNFHTNTDHALINDSVMCLKAWQNKLLVGTKSGFQVIDIASLENQMMELKCEVTAIEVYNDKVLIACESGLYKLTDSLALNKILDLPIVDIELRGQSVLCATDNTVLRLDINSGNYSELKLSQNIDQIETIKEDRNGNIWISTNDALYVYDSNSAMRRLLSTSDSNNSLALITKKSLLLDDKDIMWYASHGDGLYLIDQNFQVSHYTHNPTDKNSINQNAFTCLYQDQQNRNVWLGTFGAGINIYHPQANKFDLIKHNPLDNNSLSSNFVWSVIEDRNNCLWIGTNDKGLCKFDPETNGFTHFEHDEGNSNSLSHNTVRKVYQDRQGIIWIGTDGSGLNRLNPTTNVFKNYKHHPKDTRSLSHNSVRVIFEDSKDNLWVGTRGGLNLFDRKSGRFKRFMASDKSNSISNDFVYASIVEDREGLLWIGTYGGGLNKMNPKTGEFIHYTTSGKEGKRLSNNIVFSIYEDANDQVWIGTNEGLNVLNKSNDSIHVYGVKDGLPNEVIYSILPDADGNLWMSTNNGICCFDPIKKKCRNYDISDGLQSNEFNGGAFHKGQSGKFYFGGVYGLNVLDTENISEDQFVGSPVLTRLDILGEEITTVSSNDSGATQDSAFVLEENLSYTKHITLEYDQRFFAIEYSGLNYIFPEKTRYAFQLWPMDKKWNKAGHRNFVSFANVKPGKYEFRVISSNSDGVWSKAPAVLGITIKSPFWYTTWFILLEITLIIMLILFVYRYLLKIKMNKLLKGRNEQMAKTNYRLQQSEQHLKEMNITKDKFFSIISHDLKNPFSSLMSISNMLDTTYDMADDEDKRAGVKRINSSVKQIYNLLENLLTWSRSQRGKIEFKFDRFDLSALIQENINLYTNAASKKSISLVNKANEEVMAFGDRNTVNTIIRNLTGNAVKFTPSNGTIQYQVKEDLDKLIVSIKDTGIGINTEDQECLFCIDKKIKRDGTDGEKGTGLGLIICKEFAEKNGGEIGVVSQPGEGSEFWFTVKKHASQ